MKDKKKQNKNGKVILILNIIMTIWIIFCLLAWNGVIFKPDYSETSYNFINLGSFIVLFTIIPTVILSILFNILLFVNKNVKNYKYLFILPIIIYVGNVVWSMSTVPTKDTVAETITCVKDGEEIEYKIYEDKDPDGDKRYSIKVNEAEWMDEDDDFHGKTDNKSSIKKVKEGLSEVYSNHGGSCK